MDWKTYFDWIPVVNLKRRPERWNAFVDRYEELGEWPFRHPERFFATDGRATGGPKWMRGGNGAWGCAVSHMRILEQAMQEGYERILVLEDDAIFSPGFNDDVVKYFTALPDDWDQAYIGGQHLNQNVSKPKPVNDLVLQAFNINRTHGYALQKRFFKPLYQWLTDFPTWSQIQDAHIDHHMGRMHQTRKYNIYTPTHWLLGQAEGMSDISYKEFGDRFWEDVSKVSTDKPLKPFVAVIGLHRSGSSMTAGILKKLGVHMGNKLNGNFEADGLQHVCEKAYPFGQTKLRIKDKRLEAGLKSFVTARSTEAAARNTLAGGKYPHLCAMYKELKKATPNGLKIIHIDRPLADSKASLRTRVVKDRKRGIAWLGISEEAADAVQEWLYERKKDYIKNTPKEDILHIDYDAVLADPANVVRKIVAFLGLNVTKRQIDNAVAHVDPSKKRHGDGKVLEAKP